MSEVLLGLDVVVMASTNKFDRERRLKLGEEESLMDFIKRVVADIKEVSEVD